MTRRPCLWSLLALLLAPARAWAASIAFVSIPITLGTSPPPGLALRQRHASYCA